MNKTFEFIVRCALIGAGATVVMDVWAAVLRRFGVPSLNFAFLGRWLDKSLVTHTVFGVGLFLAARATASLIPSSN